MIQYGSQQYRKVTLALALGSFLVFCNLYLFQPMLPVLASSFSVSETQINWVFAASTLGLSISLVPWAVKSESVGRKKIMLIGLLAVPLVGLSMLLTDSMWLLVAARGAMGVSLAAFASVAVAYMVEELDQKAFRKAIGSYIAANSLGGITGRIFGGVVTDAYDWQTAVLVMALFSLVAAVVVLLILPDQKHFRPQSSSLRHQNKALLTHLKNRKVWFAMLIGGLNFALFVNLYSVMAFRLVAQPHYLPVGVASLIFLCYLAGTLSSKLTGRWTERYDGVAGMTLGSTISLLGMYLAYFEYIPSMLLGLLLIGFGAFFTHTLAYAWVSEKAVQGKATANALYLVHYYIGGSLGGFFLIYCWQHGAWQYVLFGGSVLFALKFALLSLLKRATVLPLHNIETTPSHALNK
ncbi:MFS transporter [Vibrio sonorensis]|uniref:MFS transporter n=1 Tax=Vibrio sonorensis TaxID=1004316 RepID=UPI0008D964E9|nr:MFS transporter [Vibrio sonorensis]